MVQLELGVNDEGKPVRARVHCSSSPQDFVQGTPPHSTSFFWALCQFRCGGYRGVDAAAKYVEGEDSMARCFELVGRAETNGKWIGWGRGLELAVVDGSLPDNAVLSVEVDTFPNLASTSSATLLYDRLDSVQSMGQVMRPGLEPQPHTPLPEGHAEYDREVYRRVMSVAEPSKREARRNWLQEAIRKQNTARAALNAGAESADAVAKHTWYFEACLQLLASPPLAAAAFMTFLVRPELLPDGSSPASPPPRSLMYDAGAALLILLGPEARSSIFELIRTTPQHTLIFELGSSILHQCEMKVEVCRQACGGGGVRGLVQELEEAMEAVDMRCRFPYVNSPKATLERLEAELRRAKAVLQDWPEHVEATIKSVEQQRRCCDLAQVNGAHLLFKQYDAAVEAQDESTMALLTQLIEWAAQVGWTEGTRALIVGATDDVRAGCSDERLARWRDLFESVGKVGWTEGTRALIVGATDDVRAGCRSCVRPWGEALPQRVDHWAHKFQCLWN